MTSQDSRYILHLTPTKGSPIFNCLNDARSNVSHLCGEDSTFCYPLHCSLSSFFDSKGVTRDLLVSLFWHTVHKMSSQDNDNNEIINRSIQLSANVYTPPDSTHVILPVECEFAREFAKEFALIVSSETPIEMRLKRASHVSLGHRLPSSNVSPSISATSINGHQNIANIQVFEHDVSEKSTACFAKDQLKLEARSSICSLHKFCPYMAENDTIVPSPAHPHILSDNRNETVTDNYKNKDNDCDQENNISRSDFSNLKNVKASISTVSSSSSTTAASCDNQTSRSQLKIQDTIKNDKKHKDMINTTNTIEINDKNDKNSYNLEAVPTSSNAVTKTQCVTINTETQDRAMVAHFFRASLNSALKQITCAFPHALLKCDICSNLHVSPLMQSWDLVLLEQTIKPPSRLEPNVLPIGKQQLVCVRDVARAVGIVQTIIMAPFPDHLKESINDHSAVSLLPDDTRELSNDQRQSRPCCSSACQSVRNYFQTGQRQFESNSRTKPEKRGDYSVVDSPIVFKDEYDISMIQRESNHKSDAEESLCSKLVLEPRIALKQGQDVSDMLFSRGTVTKTNHFYPSLGNFLNNNIDIDRKNEINYGLSFDVNGEASEKSGQNEECIVSIPK